ncbi:MAG: class I SAM-dependent methyltransferase [Candidatus Diapherotrites archaeon]|nr:class I SAM-dependent methyltransferase [Candidatus Diapherotrites archaeon]
MSLREKRNSGKKDSGWSVKIERPEELCASPGDYYTTEEVEKHDQSAHMKRTQRKITSRIIDLLQAKPPAKVLDIGCAVGFSTELLEELEFDATGLDVNEKMVEKAKQRGLVAVTGDMRDVKDFFEKESFDFIVSVSALQWIKDQNEIKKVASGIHSLLKKGGKAGIQFYPRSEQEFDSIFWRFKRMGLTGEVIIDNPDNPKKRVVYLVLEKT